MLTPRSAIALALLLVSSVLVVAGCGGSGDNTQGQINAAARQAAQQQKLKDEVQQLQQKVQHQSGGAGTTTVTSGATTTSSTPSDVTSCGAGVSAKSSTTSCAFALNVAKDYYSSGSATFQSLSPTTGQTYTMTCSGTSPVTCTGGNDAAVYISGAPVSHSATTSGIPSDARSCGSVYANSNTSCSFAETVAGDYASSGSSTFQAHSSVTGQDYTMSCSGSHPVVCTGGNDATVYIP